jgi:ceramide glucosyltransferase
MTIAQFAAGYSIAATSAHLLSIALAARKCRRPPPPLAPAADAQAVSIVQPLCGIEPFTDRTLAATLSLDYPAYEVLFCIARADDPITPIVRAAMAAHPGVPSRLLIGDDKTSANPKLNNVVKGWNAAAHDWVIIADSNVLMPKDYIQRLAAAWRPDAAIICSPPIGSEPATFAAEIECAFLNTYQARWQYAGEACGLGFAQGKTMYWRKSVLDEGGGIEKLGEEIAEDAAATKLVHRAGLNVHLVPAPFDQPLGARAWRDVWARQLRWARLRRATFPLHFTPELVTSGLFALIAAGVGAGVFGLPWWLATMLNALVWYGAEAALARAAGWRLSIASPLAFLLRDLALPWLWIQAWSGNAFEWRGNAMTVAAEDAPATARR